MPQTIIGYCRVSTASQASDGLSLEDQEDRIRTFGISDPDLHLEEVYVEPGISAAHLERRQLRLLRERIRTGGVDTLVVTHLDRLTRSVKDLRELLEELDQYNTRLITLDDRWGDRVGLDSFSDKDRDLMDMIAMFARWQRERIGGGTRSAHTRIEADGKAPNHPAVGFDVDDENYLVPNEQELATVLRIQELRQDGLSLRAIANELNENGIPAKKGGAWSHNTVSKVLNRLEDPKWMERNGRYLEMLRD